MSKPIIVAEAWPTARLGDIAKTSSGGTPKRTVPAYYGGGIPWVKSGELGDGNVSETKETITEKGLSASSAKVFPKGTLCIALYGATVGKLGILDMDAATNQAVCGIFLPDNIDTHFAYRFLESKRRELIELGKGGAQSNISQEIIRDLQFPLLGLNEQRNVVGEIEKQFTRLDVAISALKRSKRNIKRYRASVLKAAFDGHLVPSEAELARKEKRSYENGTQLLDRVLLARRQKWSGRGKYKEPIGPDTSAFSSLPEGWSCATIEQISTLVQYGTSAKTNENLTGIPVLRMGNIEDGKLVFDKLKYLPKNHYDFPKLILESGDLLFNRTNSAELVGKTAVYKGLPQRCSFASYLIGVRFAVGCLPDIAAYFINSVHGKNWISKVVSQQVGQANVNGTKLQNLTMPLPPFAEQKRIVAEVERRLSILEEAKNTVDVNLRRATSLRQSILHKAFTGKRMVEKVGGAPLIKTNKVKSPNRHFARALLSAEIVHQLYKEPTFGRVKHQKIFHLCEHIAQLEDIQGQYHREAAGPLDNKLIYTNEAELKKQNWFKVVPREKYGHAYQPMAKCGEHVKYMGKRWANKQAVISRLIELMKKWDTERCEIFSTTYAAWNDLIIWHKEVTDEAILNEVLNRWHDSKRRISKERWLKAIEWMRKEKFIPTGFGKPTAQPG